MTYDEKLERVLRRATAVFAEKGYHRASIRDIARATGMSLAGLHSSRNEGFVGVFGGTLV